jgi:hypothetical protein
MKTIDRRTVLDIIVAIEISSGTTTRMPPPRIGATGTAMGVTATAATNPTAIREVSAV